MESITATISSISYSIGTPCLICGDTVTICDVHQVPQICEKCKSAVLHVRKNLEKHEKDPIPKEPCETCIHYAGCSEDMTSARLYRNYTRNKGDDCWEPKEGK